MNNIQHKFYILNKPYGVLSAFVNNQKKRKNKKLLGDMYTFAPGTMAIGRLDEDSEGLLLLTDSGQLSYDIRNMLNIEKEYYVQVDGIITNDAIAAMVAGVEITVHKENYHTLPCKVCMIDPPTISNRSKPIRDERHGPTSWISITLIEGKFHQIRKMTASINHPTLRLIRIRIGNISLFNFKLEFGDVIEVDSFDI